MRGKAVGKILTGNGIRITPAYAGKSFTKGIFSTRAKDHPRLCGEKCVTCQLEVSDRGSPPPMRGKDKEEEMCDAEFRITPAYAGKSLPRFAGFIQSQDHPRLCGEKYPVKLLPDVCTGSPPPMRGKVFLYSLHNAN